jgi:fatty-acyl-CoA synthase
VLAPDASVDAEELRGWLTERMARYKVPRHIIFWEELPRSGYGKIVRRTVREMLVEAGLGTSGSTTDSVVKG